MIWVVGGCLAFGFALCVVALIANSSANPDNRSAAPIYWVAGLVLLFSAVVLALGNAAVKALL